MSLNSTPSSERIHIGFFGVRNAGKSSVVNRITNQDVSIVSDVKGTTTDAVKKTMELLPLGAVVIIDTAGIDDEGTLGEMRVKSTKRILSSCDIAVLVTESRKEYQPCENELISLFEEKKIPYVIAHNKSDLYSYFDNTERDVFVSAKDNTGFEELKGAIATALGKTKKEIRLVADFIEKNDFVVLVTPIDASAPKGRMILPQQQAIRDIIDSSAISVVTQVEELETVLDALAKKPALVVTDSQVFTRVMKLVPDDIPLTSFSILMARYKGFLDTAVKGARVIESLGENAKVLISEGCTHHRQCEDIGTVKLPKWLEAYTKKHLNFEFTSGHGYPDDLSAYDLVIHCGACMLNDAEIKSRMEQAVSSNVPFTNYGTVIAYINGILDRSIDVIYK
ncbi:MAG: [Eubacterium sp.]|nr:[FeFe] hydrogenase H-cluster maturation GTPase HydF [Eubacterium sp.]